MKVADLLANLQFTAFPLVFPAAIRIYTGLFGAGDFALRVFGALVSVGFVLFCWFSSFRINRQPPMLMLALIGLNSTFLTVGAWVRGYGLASVLLLLVFTFSAEIAKRFTPARLVATLVSSVVATQCLFFDGVLVPAILLSTMIVLVLRRDIRPAMLLLAGGILIACCYIPYIINIYSNVRPWAKVLQEPVSRDWIWNELNLALGAPSAVMRWIWLSVIVIPVAGGLYLLKRNHAQHTLMLFGLCVIFFSVAAFVGFMVIVAKPPLQHYYLAPLFVVAAATDLIVSQAAGINWIRVARLAIVAVLIALTPFDWALIRVHETNIDMVARQLENKAQPADLIVLNTWSRAMSFDRYYHGSAPWMTIPEIPEHRVPRYDLLQKKMQQFFPLDDVEIAISHTLKAGNRVWLVGEFKGATASRRPLVLAPAPDPKFGWRSTVYSISWGHQIVDFVRHHASLLDVVEHPSPSVNPNENNAIILAKGWEH